MVFSECIMPLLVIVLWRDDYLFIITTVPVVSKKLKNK